MTDEEFLKLTYEATAEAQEDLRELLEFSKTILNRPLLKDRPKAKTIMRLNTYSAMYQRAISVLELSKIEQGNVANIIIRSMWETLVTYDFINLNRGNVNADILLALESQQLMKNSKHIKQLREQYPDKNTWQTTLTDEKLDKHIKKRQNEINRFNKKYPTLKLGSYSNLINRLKVLDETLHSRDVKYDTITQFDYRTVYSVLSDDVHSTMIGNMGNTRLISGQGGQIRLDSPKMETLRSTQVAFTLFLNLVKSLNSNFRLNVGRDLRRFRSMSKTHDRNYSNIESRM